MALAILEGVIKGTIDFRTLMRLPPLPSVMRCGCGVAASSGTLVATWPWRTEKDPERAVCDPLTLIVIVP